MADDLRMGFAVRVSKGKDVSWVRLLERRDDIVFADLIMSDTAMTPAQARTLARSLYRLARRVDKRHEVERLVEQAEETV